MPSGNPQTENDSLAKQSDEQFRADDNALPGTELLRAENIGFSVLGKTILTDVSLQLHNKEIITLIGPNGAGKTSLILKRQIGKC